MTAPTPEQMRALAAHHQSDVDYYGYSAGSLSAKTAAALRAAADQLEAIGLWGREQLDGPPSTRPWAEGYDCAARDVLDILATEREGTDHEDHH